MNRIQTNLVNLNEERRLQENQNRNPTRSDSSIISMFELFWLYLTGFVFVILIFLLLLLSLFKDRTIDNHYELPNETTARSQ